MKLNKLERHTAYIIMLAEAEKSLKDYNYNWGLCWLINRCFGFTNADVSSEDVEWMIDSVTELFPELQTAKPNGKMYWFPKGPEGTKQRIELLKQCIQETY
jgi:hypothetical protein